MNRRHLLWIVIGSIVVLIIFVTWNSSRVTEADYVGANVTIEGATLQVRVPVTLAAQTKGLGGVASLTDTDGMMWRYETPQMVSFWMKGMLIPLDFIWIRDGKVIGLTTDVQPPNETNEQLPIYTPPSDVDRVLEVRAGFTAAHEITIGSAVTER